MTSKYQCLFIYISEDENFIATNSTLDQDQFDPVQIIFNSIDNYVSQILQNDNISKENITAAIENCQSFEFYFAIGEIVTSSINGICCILLIISLFISGKLMVPFLVSQILSGLHYFGVGVAITTGFTLLDPNVGVAIGAIIFWILVVLSFPMIISCIIVWKAMLYFDIYNFKKDDPAVEHEMNEINRFRSSFATPDISSIPSNQIARTSFLFVDPSPTNSPRVSSRLSSRLNSRESTIIPRHFFPSTSTLPINGQNLGFEAEEPNSRFTFNLRRPSNTHSMFVPSPEQSSSPSPRFATLNSKHSLRKQSLLHVQASKNSLVQTSHQSLGQNSNLEQKDNQNLDKDLDDNKSWTSSEESLWETPGQSLGQNLDECPPSRSTSESNFLGIDQPQKDQTTPLPTPPLTPERSPPDTPTISGTATVRSSSFAWPKSMQVPTINAKVRPKSGDHRTVGHDENCHIEECVLKQMFVTADFQTK